MREEISANLERTRTNPLNEPIPVYNYEEIIVRDVRRIDAFPDLEEDGVGISPWLKLEVNGFYHRGIEVFFSESRKAIPIADSTGSLGGWRLLDQHETNDQSVDAVPIGRIPFDFIERIDWSRSDGYYNAPQFYCRYAGPLRQPYEEIIYRATLYPDSHYLSELYGLKHETSEWSAARRGCFMAAQAVVRTWRRTLKLVRRSSRNASRRSGR